MVLKENVTKIVCLCENVGQTGQESTNYFEIEEDLKTGSSTIYCQDTLDTENFTRRHLLLEPEMRQIEHIHYKKWPDMSVPGDL